MRTKMCLNCGKQIDARLSIDYCSDVVCTAVMLGYEEKITQRPAVHPFTVITSELYDLYIRKNHDYGNSFSEQFRELGMASSIIRLSDKLSRLKTLHSKQAEVMDESIRDTLIDLANYAIMTVMELDQLTEEAEK